MNKKRKWYITVLAIIICLLLVVPQVLTLFAADASADEPVGEIMVSFYDDKNSESIIGNTKIEIFANQTISDLLSTLRAMKIIKSFSANDRTIMNITTAAGKLFSAIADQSSRIVILINATVINESTFVSPLNNGDIVEIFYTANPTKFAKTNSTVEVSSSNVQSLSSAWTSELTKVQNDAFEWLNRNISTSSSYLMTAGITGKTADIKAVNNFINEFAKGRQYDTPMAIAKDVLSLTFSGYDASSEKYGKLISKLSNYADITKTGIFGAVNTLTAYDCNNYYVPTTAINSRGSLVEQILKFQNSDGGFPITLGGKSDVDTTAMTITAISAYREYPNATVAIDNAVAYLSTVQTKSGGFGFQGKDNLESLCTVIIALNACSIDLDDERFQKNDTSLTENLLQYKNNDGGFAHTIGDKSTSIPTEQALAALTAIKKNSNPLKLTKLVEIDTSVKETETTSMSGDYSGAVVIWSSIIAFVAIATIILLIVTRKKKMQIKND